MFTMVGCVSQNEPISLNQITSEYNSVMRRQSDAIQEKHRINSIHTFEDNMNAMAISRNNALPFPERFKEKQQKDESK